MLELENSDQVSQKAHFRSTCVFVCLFICCIFLRYRINQRNLGNIPWCYRLWMRSGARLNTFHWYLRVVKLSVVTSVDTFKWFSVALLITGVGRPPLEGGNAGNDTDPSYFCGRLSPLPCFALLCPPADSCPPDRRQLPGSAPFSELNIQFAFSSTIWVAPTSFGVGCWSE